MPAIPTLLVARIASDSLLSGAIAPGVALVVARFLTQRRGLMLRQWVGLKRSLAPWRFPSGRWCNGGGYDLPAESGIGGATDPSTWRAGMCGCRMIRLAVAVIPENLDDTALAHPAMAAFFHHALQLSPQRNELGNPAFHIAEMTTGNLVGGRTRLIGGAAHFEKFADGSDLETKLTRMPNEVETAKVGALVASLLPFSPLRHFQKPDLLVVADGRNLDAAASGDFPD